MSYVQVFESIDKNKDGKVSWDEFSQYIRAFSPSMASEEIDKMFKELDVDGDGHIDVIEFSKCFLLDDDDQDKESVLKSAFDLFDTNGDGKISPGELHDVLNRLGEKKSMKECVDMVRAVVDQEQMMSDQNLFVGFEQFKTMMSSNNNNVAMI